MTDAERLRETAQALREQAERAPGGPWFFSGGTHGNPSDGPTYVSVVSKATGHPICEGDYDRHDGEAAVYIATMHPGVGLALADWLDDLADHGASDLMPMERGAFVIADLILGGIND